MNIIFIGNSNISLSFLKLINKYDFKLFVFISNKKKFSDDYVDLKPFLIKNKITYFKFKKINSKRVEHLFKKIKPNYLLSLGSSEILNKSLLNIPLKGTIGFHPTELPFNRGKHPIIWTIILGLRQSATTFFYLNNEIDCGEVISQKKFTIPNKIDANKLLNIITKNGLIQLNFILKAISLNRKLNSYKQNLLKSNYWRKRNYLDGIINWKMSFSLIERHIKALSYPYSGAEFIYKNKRIKIFSIKKLQKNINFEPGKILATYKNKTFDIACFDYQIRIIKYYPIIDIKKDEYI